MNLANGSCSCQPGRGAGCAACRKAKQTCRWGDDLFAANPALRRAARAYYRYANDAHAQGNTHVTKEGTIGANPDRPRAGKYPEFNSQFNRLRQTYEELLSAAQSHPVAPTPLAGREPAPSDAWSSPFLALAPGRSRNADVQALAGASQAAFAHVTRRLESMENRLVDLTQQSARRAAIEATPSTPPSFPIRRRFDFTPPSHQTPQDLLDNLDAEDVNMGLEIADALRRSGARRAERERVRREGRGGRGGSGGSPRGRGAGRGRGHASDDDVFETE